MPKSWFLPPDFTFLPDGELRLGLLLKYPNRPTLPLAYLGDAGNTSNLIPLPTITTLTETGHAHSSDSSRTNSLSLFAKALELASASGNTGLSQFSNRSFGAVDHEIRTFSRDLAPGVLRAIVQLDVVKKFMNGGPFGRLKKRPVYLLSGLRVVKESFAVTEAKGSGIEVGAEAGVSPAVFGVPVPLEVGTGAATAREREESHTYTTAPGVIFAYRLHVIRSKSDGVETELFSDTTGFMTRGDGSEDSDDDEGDEMEAREATGSIVQSDELGLEEYAVGEETLLVFKS